MNKQEFLEKYNFTEKDLSEANITWEELELIAEEYRKNEQSLRDCGKSFIDEYLYDIEKAGIHSYRYRIKELEHILEKLFENARKTRKNLKSLTTQTIISF